MALTPVEIRHIKLAARSSGTTAAPSTSCSTTSSRASRRSGANARDLADKVERARGGPRALPRARDAAPHDARLRRARVAGAQGAGAARGPAHARRRHTPRRARIRREATRRPGAHAQRGTPRSVRCSVRRSRRSKRTTARTTAEAESGVAAKLGACRGDDTTQAARLPGARRPGVVGPPRRRLEAARRGAARGRPRERAVVRLLADDARRAPRDGRARFRTRRRGTRSSSSTALEQAQTERRLAPRRKGAAERGRRTLPTACCSTSATRIEGAIENLQARDPRLARGRDGGEDRRDDNHLADARRETPTARSTTGSRRTRSRCSRRSTRRSKRIEDGTYGTCTNCGKPIAEERLEARPWAGLCIDCQREVEQPMSEPRPRPARRARRLGDRRAGADSSPERSTPPARRNGSALGAVAVAAVVADQVTKRIVRAARARDSQASARSSIHHVQNSGIAFGLFSSATRS